jgi:hypothetical protein
VSAVYCYSKDTRPDKDERVPRELQREVVVLARWRKETLRKRVEKKFNQLGWFKCHKDRGGRFSHVQFGKPITFETFIALVRKGDIICDCGMYDGNPRPYMQWRATKKVWDQLAE